MQDVTAVPMERIEAVFTGGIMRGTKVLSMRADVPGGGTVLEAAWDVGFAGAAGLFAGAIGRHIRGGTEQALAAIKAEAERRASKGEGGGRGPGAGEGP